MLTTDDLRAIDELLVRRIDEVITKRISELVPPVIDRALKPVWKELRALRKSVNEVISYFDNEIVALRKRMEKIEWRFGVAAN